MRVSKKQLLRIIREEAAAADDAAETESTDTDDAEETASTEEDDAPVSVSEAKLRRRVRRALQNQMLKETRLFGGIGFEGLGQTNRANHARAYHGTYSRPRKNRVVKEAAPAGGDAKDILYNVVLPALAEAGFSGIEGFKMVRKVAEAMEADIKGMFGS